ncbi:MAG: PilZ domain-containing protein [Acidobacteriia bacterium]|nr:PilZ domain-containing protein [Terriglobia bacterium]
MQSVSTVQDSRQRTGTAVRKHVRYRCYQNLSVRYRIKNQEMIASGRCTVVGKGGLGALLPAAQLEVGQEVLLEITISRVAATVALKARVKDRHGLNHGFEFLENAGRVTVTLKPLFQEEAIIFNLAVPAVPQLLSPKVAQRRHERVPASGEVTLILLDGPVEVRIPARLIKISQGGFQINHGHTEFAVGQQLMVVYAGVPILCRVVWNRAVNDQFESGFAILDTEE